MGEARRERRDRGTRHSPHDVGDVARHHMPAVLEKDLVKLRVHHELVTMKIMHVGKLPHKRAGHGWWWHGRYGFLSLALHPTLRTGIACPTAGDAMPDCAGPHQ